MNFVGEGSYSVAEFRKKQENAVEVKEKWKIVGDSVRIFLKATLKKKKWGGDKHSGKKGIYIKFLWGE